MSTTNHDSRALFRRLFRPAVSSDHPGDCWRPFSPSSYWKSTIPCPDFTAQPPRGFIDSINFAPFGRIIRTIPSQSPVIYLIVSFRQEISRIPPHPGYRPPELRSWMHPRWVTTDGSFGPFNDSRYPQLFDHHRPWGGFHRFFSAPSAQFMESYNAVDFFDWSGINEDEGMTGGRWKLDMIEALFISRACRETSLAQVLEQIGDPEGQGLLRRFGTHLPFFDPTTLTEVALWKRWADGKDFLGYTIRYIAELAALHDWLLEVQRQSTPSLSRAPIRQDYSGLWVGTVSHVDDWKFLFHSPLPLFGLITIPESNSLSKQATPGTLDADEFYRNDPVLQSLHRFPSTYDREFPSHAIYIPISIPSTVPRFVMGPPSPIRTALPPQLTASVERIHYSQPYTTYLFSDTRIPRDLHWQVPSSRQKELRRRSNRIFTAIAKKHLPPFVKDTDSLRLPFHPMSSLLCRRRLNSRTKRVFVEETQSIFSWPREISKNEWRRVADDYKYCHDLRNNDFLYSDHPWPLAEDVLVYEDEDEFHDYAPHFASGSRQRVYIHKEPSDKMLEKLPSDRAIMPPALKRGYDNQPGTSKGVHRALDQDIFSWENDDDDDNDLLNCPIRQRSGHTPPPLRASGQDGDDIENHEDSLSLPIKPGPLPLARRGQYSGSYSHPKPAATYSTEGLIHPNAVVSMDIDGTLGSAESVAIQGGALSPSVPAPSAQLEDRQERAPEPDTLSSTSDGDAMEVVEMLKSPPPPPPSSEISSPSIISADVSDLPAPLTSTPTTSTTISTPAVSTSTVSTPVVSAASISIPTVSVPSVPSPTISTSSISTPPASPTTSAPPVASTAGHDALMDSLQRIRHARHVASTYMAHRLNKPVVESLLAESIQQCDFRRETDGKTLTCYCLRISNVDIGSSSPKIALNAILSQAVAEEWGEIVMISVHLEVDESWSVDLGFRYVDDAVVMWTRHGKRNRGRNWDIQPVQAVLGIAFITKFSKTGPRSLSERIRRLQSCQILEDMLGQEHTSVPNYRCSQIVVVLTAIDPDFVNIDHPQQLATPVIDQWANDFVDTHDHILASSPSPLDLLDGMHSPVLSRSDLWTSSPLPEDGHYRCGVVGFSPSYKPRNSEPSRSTKKHRRHRMNDAKLPAPDLVNPETSRGMTSTERSVCRKHTRHIAEVKRSCWLSETLRLPPVPPKTKNQPLVDEMADLWCWYEDCFSVVQNAYAMSGLSSLPPTTRNTVSITMIDSFLAAERSFAPASRLRKLFGPEYRLVMTRIDVISNGTEEHPYHTTQASHDTQLDPPGSTETTSHSSAVMVSTTESWAVVRSSAESALDDIVDETV